MPEQTAWQTTACILCECNCGLEVQVEDRHLVRIRGDERHPSSAGYTCEKALRLDKYQSGKHRLDTPLRRRPDGSHEPISWDTAIAEIAQRLGDIRDVHGGDSVFFYGGGGQGNHLGGVYAQALQAALGSHYRSNALAQEKTGEMWVDAKLYGAHTKGDFEHTEVAVFLGKNPWQSHGFPRARATLREIARDPARTLVVIDPRRSESAELADVHLQVRPGTDAWALAAILGTIVREGLVDERFLAEHTTGGEHVLKVLGDLPVDDCADACGVDVELLRTTARRIATAGSVATYEDLGTQQGPNSTLVSYLNKLVWILTGNFGKPGSMHLHSSFAAIAGSAAGSAPAAGARPSRVTPVTGARIIAGLVPCNSIADEILTDHPDRFRAMWIDSSNPAHSLAESARFTEALDALDLVVLVDVAFTETARHADYVLPAASQFEKWETTFFASEFPANTVQLRPPLMDPLPGTFPEPEIYARLLRLIAPIDAEVESTLRAAAAEGRDTFTAAFFAHIAAHPEQLGVAPFLLHETLGPTLPDGAEATAALWGAAQVCALTYPDAVRRAGHADGNVLFDALLTTPQGIVFTLDTWDDVWSYVRRPDRRFTVEIAPLLEQLRQLPDTTAGWTSEEFPFVLSAGERRAFTANTIYRDPTWRRRGADGALRLSPSDADRLQLTDGDRVRITTRGGTAVAAIEISDSMQPGHVSLPNGMGVNHPELGQVGVAPNDLTTVELRDDVAGTPWHKHVPARLERVPAE